MWRKSDRAGAYERRRCSNTGHRYKPAAAEVEAARSRVPQDNGKLTGISSRLAVISSEFQPHSRPYGETASTGGAGIAELSISGKDSNGTPRISQDISAGT